MRFPNNLFYQGEKPSGSGCYIEIEMLSVLSLVGSRLDFVTQSRNETPGDNANE